MILQGAPAFNTASDAASDAPSKRDAPARLAARRRFDSISAMPLSTVSKLCALAVAFAALAIALPAAAAPPNVVFIISDDQGWTDYGFMGHAEIKTPRLDRLAAESLAFTRGYVPSSLCRPSLATLATGLYPHQHGITSNDPPEKPKEKLQALRDRMVEIFRRSPTLAGILARKGYASHQSGKWWEGHCRCGEFTEGMTHGEPKNGGRHGDDGLSIGRETMQPIFDFIDKREGKPFFIWYAPFLPHVPHNPPARILDRYLARNLPPALARYYASCEWFDETCGQLLDFLERRCLAESTLVVYVSDNGWIQKTEATPLPSGWPHPHAPRSKRSPYDMGIRTPILLRWPGRILPRRDETTLASSIDLAPTVLCACGIEPGAGMPGVDLLSPSAAAARGAVFGSIFTHNAIDIEAPGANVLYRWVVQGRWKLIVPHFANVPDAPIELYDLSADPHETRNLAVDEERRAAELLHRLDRWWELP
jgi:uncharacterized sulfatase